MLVSLVAPRLLGYAAQLASDLGETDREAIVEAAIETAIDKIDQFDPNKGTFPGWVRTFVYYEVATWRRSHGAPPEELVEPAVGLTDDDVDGPPSAAALAMTALVLTLPEASQLLLRLRFAEHLDHTEIAERLGIKPAASRKRLERVLTDLRERSKTDPDLTHLGGDE
jgi:RNA polymerase sigma factor (sigma-70 family)